MDPAVTPEGKEAAFASDQDRDDFEIYMAKAFTGEVQRVTDNAMDDRNPAGPTYGKNITNEAERGQESRGPRFTQGPVLWLSTSCVDRPFSPPK